MESKKVTLNLSLVIMPLLLLYTFTDWWWALSIVEWTVNILYTFVFLIIAIIIAYRYTGSGEAVFTESDNPKGVVERVFDWTTSAFMVYCFWLNDLTYSMSLIVVMFCVSIYFQIYKLWRNKSESAN